ncbi:MAG TPA: FtsX-like permease family protein, partial [Thermoanaerobaculia bacterium]|nr:FtsX-like permease family protein [Thermoanaerobaculia bacterium]
MSGFSLVFRALVTGPARRHPMRVALPALGVAIGVAAVAAIHHANRSVTESFREAASSVSGRSDFVITGAAGIPVADLAALAFLWRFASFAPAVAGPAILADGSGEVLQILGVDWGGDAAVRDFRLVGADSPTARAHILASGGSVLVSAPFAARHGLSPGSPLAIVAGGVRRETHVGGVLELSGVARASGGDLILTDIFTAQDLLGRRGTIDRVDVVLSRGVSRDAARREITARLPPGLSLEPPGRAAETADRMVRAFRFNLNALGSLTLLVGMFLIANAVSIAVLRRRPEIATLRALGASREAVFGAFLLEGLVIGIVGTLAGEVLGVFAARAALSAIGGTVTRIYLPSARIAGAGGGEAALLAAAVGLGAAVAATLLPAIEATRVDPSPAMRPGSFEGAARGRLGARAAAAAAALLLAAAAAAVPAIDGFPLFGFAAVALVVAALAFASPLLVRSLGGASARLLAPGAPPEGRLGAGFFAGAPARNGLAVTALAMALGMTLAMIVTVASIRETVRIWVESTLRSDLWIKAEAGPHSGIVGDLPPDIVPFLRAIPGVAAVDPFRAREA